METNIPHSWKLSSTVFCRAHQRLSMHVKIGIKRVETKILLYFPGTFILAVKHISCRSMFRSKDRASLLFCLGNTRNIPNMGRKEKYQILNCNINQDREHGGLC